MRIRLEGIVPERFLNLCCNRGIVLWDIRCEDGAQTCCILLQDFWKLRPLSRKTHTKVRVTGRFGLPFVLRSHWRRKGALAGVTLFFLLLYFMSGRIWSIDIEGNHQYTDELLLRIISEQGIGHGMSNRGISCVDLEKAIRTAYDRITWVSARIDGTRLVVQVKENDTGLAEVSEEAGSGELAADCSGIVRSIITRNGTPAVKVGDEVQAGDTLISGLLTIYDDGGEAVAWHDVRADGDILIEYRTFYEKRILRSRTVRRYTGESRRHVLRIGGWHLQLLPFLPCGEQYDRYEEIHQLCLLDNFYLPLYFGSVTRREYVYEAIPDTDEALLARAEYEIQKDITELENLGVQIIENNVTITVQENGCLCQGELVLWKQTGEFRSYEDGETAKLEWKQTD